MQPRVIVEWLLRLGLGGLLILAGALKLKDPVTFANDITNYRFLPMLAPLLAVVLPPIEVVLGIALVIGKAPWPRAAALASLGLLVVFTIAVIQVVARGINVSCGCFGGDTGPVTWVTIARDVGLVLAAGTLIEITPKVEK